MNLDQFKLGHITGNIYARNRGQRGPSLLRSGSHGLRGREKGEELS